MLRNIYKRKPGNFLSVKEQTSGPKELRPVTKRRQVVQVEAERNCVQWGVNNSFKPESSLERE